MSRPDDLQEELKASQERYRLLVEGVQDYAIFMLDPAGRVISWNVGAEHITGYHSDEILGRHFSRLYGEEEVVRGKPGRVLEAAIDGGRFEDEGWLVRKDGTRYWAHAVVTALFDEAGRLRGFSQITHDLTEREQANEALRSVLDHVIDGIITIDGEGTVQSFNPAAEAIFGYRAAEVLGRNVKLLMPEPYHGEHDSYLANYYRTGQPKVIGIGREVLGRRSDGTTFPMDLAVSEFRLDDRRFFTGIVRDITERKQLEHELRSRLAELAEADHRKDEFLAMLAHELRNPLAAISSAVQLADGTEDPEHREWSREVIDRQIKQLARLIDDLLDVSRITRGKIQLRKETIDLTPLVRYAIETVRPLLDDRKHELTLDLPPAALWVEADPTRLEQILTNLLNNAAKYTDNGGRIKLSAHREGGDVAIRVRDTGIGLAAEDLTQMFDLFAQGDRSLARSEGGLGIGLTLVRSLAEMHGGSVTAASEGPGRGAEFTVRLPAADPPRADAGRAEPPSAGALSSRVLVVDDNVDLARGLSRLLKLLGHEVRMVHDGESALGAARAFLPDVVLLDIGLPGMDGYYVASLLREEDCGRDARIIAITGYGHEEDRRRSLAAGFNEHLVKPIDFRSLVSLFAEPAA